jgi:hypothetical protein
VGVFMMWFLAYKMEMSTIPSTDVESLVDEYQASPKPAE